MSVAEIRHLFEQRTLALSRHPSLGKAAHQASARLTNGLACEVSIKSRTTYADLPAEAGGSDSAPTPGDLMRAALGACLAMGYRVWAARLAVELSAVEVDVTCELDERGQLGVADDVPVGWQRLLVAVRIVTDAPADAVHRVVECADRFSPLLANLSPAIARLHSLEIRKSTTPTL